MSQGLVLSFLRRSPNVLEWTQQELAEFYRVEGALLQAGLSVTTDRGLSDEGDPWFVFCRADNEEVIAHFARIDREYVIVSNVYSGAARGRDFRLLIRQMLEMHHLMLPTRRQQGQKVFLHPAALLTALLASAYLLSSDKDLTGDHGASDADGKAGVISTLLRQKFGISAVLALAIAWVDHQTDVLAKLWDTIPLFASASDEKSAHAAIAHDHDAAPLDGLQVATALDLNAHRTDVSKHAVDVQAAHGDSDHHLALANLTATAAANPADKAADASVTDGSALNAVTGSGHLDLVQDSGEAAGAAYLQGAIAVRSTVVTEASSPSGSTDGPSSASAGSSMAMHDAMQAVSEFGSSALAPIVLSNGAESLDAALQQAYAQVGLAPATSHSSASAPAQAVAAPAIDTTQPAAVVTPPPTDAAPQQQGPAIATDAQVVQSLETFLQDTPSYDVFESGNHLIYMTANMSDATSPNFTSETFTMSDGSTLTIVGIIPHLASSAAVA